MQYIDLAAVYDSLVAEPSSLKKAALIATLLKKGVTTKQDALELILLLQGKVFSQADEAKIGYSTRLVIKSIAISAGFSEKEIEERWRSLGDLGLVAEELLHKKKQNVLFSSPLSVDEVFSSFRKIASYTGEGSVSQKVKLFSRLLSSATPLEAKYLVRGVLEELRVGVAEGTLRDAIVRAFLDQDGMFEQDEGVDEGKYNDREQYVVRVSAVQRAIDLSGDLALVCYIAKTEGLEGLEKIRLVPGSPIRVMLGPKMETIEQALKTVGVPAAIEYKYDGFRILAHKVNGVISLYTRKLELVTNQFPEVVAALNKGVAAKEFILDGEAVGIDPKTKKYLPFQFVSQRIRRKYRIDELAKKLPCVFVVFDALFADGVTLLDESNEHRRAALEKLLVPLPHELELATRKIISSEQEAQEFYERSLGAGNEGVMFKNLSSPYALGKRVGHMVKMKPTLETFDLVIVGAEWGEGKRSGWLTSFLLACRTFDGEYVSVGRVGTGLKEKEELGVSFSEMTELLRPYILEEVGREVRLTPHIVVEVAFEEIQKSTTYEAGFALRFPRILRLRDDRGSDSITSLDHVADIFDDQRHATQKNRS
ncbi:MAG: ATP-dependent DNA ligase [Candidatus Woesearchaeota archaeon]|nr:MAG: ATP-dependent DNA ligase [Candidatus Woesearchaeota archaeon]